LLQLTRQQASEFPLIVTSLSSEGLWSSRLGSTCFKTTTHQSSLTPLTSNAVKLKLIHKIKLILEFHQLLIKEERFI